MDERLLTMARSNGNVFSRRDAVTCAVSDLALERWLRLGEIVRIHRAMYVLGSSWAGAWPDERYRLRAHAVYHCLRQVHGAVWLSHHAAVSAHDLPLWGADLSQVDVMVDGLARTRSVAGVTRRRLPEKLRTATRAVPLPAALVQCARASGTVAATVSADAALREKKVSLAALQSAVEADPARARLLGWLAGLDARCESVGESRLRLILVGMGLAVQSQVNVRDGDGVFIGRVDFLVKDRIVIEFDGLQKYASANGREALALEKKREERLRDAGYLVLRVVWSELDDAAALRRRIEVQLGKLLSGRR